MTAVAKNKAVETSRCSGHCCRAFFLKESVLETLTEPNANWDDAKMIRDMVIFLHWDVETAGGSFTCKHFDTETNNCTVYDRRPKMCRNYPYGKECTFEGCTYKLETKEKTDAQRDQNA